MLDLLKLLGILALILVLIRFRVNLGLVLIVAAAVTGLLFGRAPRDMILDAVSASTEWITLQLVAIVLLIGFMGEILRSSLQMEGLVRSLSDLVADRRWLLALMPSMIGLLPMAGGAMFSAPMVEEASQGLNLSRERRTFINYWFRHPWESALPLYPAFVLATGLLNCSPQALMITQWPIFLAAQVGGILFGVLGIRRSGDSIDSRPPRKQTWWLLLKSIWPILLVLGLSLLLHVDLILALLATIATLIAAHRPKPRQLLALVTRTPWEAAPIILGTMIFRRVLETGHVIEAASNILAGLGIPLPIVVFTVPLLAGLLTGLAAAAFAIGFPIVLPLCGPDVVGSGYALLAYTGGLLGLLLSPLHLCLTLTRTYFQAQWGGIYRRILPAALLMAVSAAAAFFVRQ